MSWSIVGAPWIEAVIPIVKRDTELLRSNGATHCADARDTMLKQLLDAFREWNDTEVDVSQAAVLANCSTETIRRAIRSASLSAVGRRGKRLRRGDVLRWIHGDTETTLSDAQDIAHQRRQK